ncbi:MAG: HNH endonuclease [Archangium sp.]|nr:HNH endonuclease [Archangium sp.]
MRQHKSLASFVTGIGAGFMCAASPVCSGPPDPLLPEFAREHHGGVFIGGLLAAGFGSFEMILGLRGLMNSGAAARTGVGIPLAAIGSVASGAMVVHGALTAIKGGAIAAAGLNAAMAGKGSGGSKPQKATPQQSNPSKPSPAAKAKQQASVPKSDQPIRNAHLAGKKHPVTGVPFDKKGYPDFSKYKHPKVKDVRIELSGSRSTDFARANAEAGLKETPAGYTWHHHQDPGRMQLVETGPHKYTGHTGGFTATP